MLYYDDYCSDEEDDPYYLEEFEYMTLNPYDYDLNTFSVKSEETPLEKLQNYIKSEKVENFRDILMELIVINKPEIIKENGVNKTVSESGDLASDENDESDVEADTFMDNNEDSTNSVGVVKEIFLPNNDTPLIAVANLANYEMMSILIKSGFDVNYKIKNSFKTPLIALCMTTLSYWFEDTNKWRENSVKCLRLLLDNGADPTVKSFISNDDFGNIVTHYAALNNHWQLMEILLHTNVDIDAMNQHRKSALMLAASKGHVACCNMLLTNGADAHLKDKSNMTAAEIAESNGFTQLADSLNIYSGQAQHNFRLFKLWNSFSNNSRVDKKQTNNVSKFTTGDDISYNHSCIESFCLSIDAPYLINLMENQGLTISDLKKMDESSLSDLGISMHDCIKIINTAKDILKTPKIKENRVVSEYSRPLKPVTLLEIFGNIQEHVEYMGSHIESLVFHLDKNDGFYQDKYQIVNRATIMELKNHLKNTVTKSTKIMKEVSTLNDVINKTYKPDSDQSHENPSISLNSKKKPYRFLITALVSTGGVAAVTVATILLYRKYLK